MGVLDRSACSQAFNTDPLLDNKPSGQQAMAIPARVIVLAFSLLVFGAPPAAAEDVTITYTVSYGENGTPIRTKYISPDRAEAWSGPDYGFITDSTGKKTRIDHARAQYTETTEQEENAALVQLQRMPAAKSPPVSTSVSFEKKPDRRTIAGQDCEHYVVTTRRHFGDGRPEPSTVVNRHDYWIAPDLRLETERARMFEMGARILQDAPGDVIKDVLSKGLVLAETWSVNDRFIASEEATEFKTGPINPSVFSAPPGYTKVESLSAAIIRENADVEYSAVGTCRQTIFTAVGADDDKNVAWDATKKAWRSCVTERLGEPWTVIPTAKRQCFPREKKMAWASVVAQGTEIVTCGQPGGDPKGKLFCHLDATPCTAPTTP
jgi:hypothetical protein